MNESFESKKDTDSGTSDYENKFQQQVARIQGRIGGGSTEELAEKREERLRNIRSGVKKLIYEIENNPQSLESSLHGHIDKLAGKAAKVGDNEIAIILDDIWMMAEENRNSPSNYLNEKKIKELLIMAKERAKFLLSSPPGRKSF